MNNNGTCNKQCLTPNCLYDFSYGDEYPIIVGDYRNFEMDTSLPSHDCTLD